MMKTLRNITLCSIIASLFPFVAFADSVRTRQPTLYPYQSTIRFQEDFIYGSSASSVIGWMGFAYSAGTALILSGEANRPGIIQKSTTAVMGTISNLTPENISSIIGPGYEHQIHWEIRAVQVDNDTLIRVGAMNSSAANPPTNGIYFQKDLTDTNWFCVTKNGGTVNAVDSGIAVSTSFIALRYTRTAAGVQFNINNTNVCGLMTGASLPDDVDLLAPSTHIINNVAAEKFLDHDYMQLILSGIVR